MTIYSPTTAYTAIARVDGHRLRARDASGKERLLVFADGAEAAKRLAPMLLRWRRNPAFTDFVEFFPYADGLCAAFAHHADGQPAALALSAAAAGFRAAALRSLFARLLAQDAPKELLPAVAGGLRFSAVGAARFWYDLPAPSDPPGAYAALAGAVLSIGGDPTADEVTAFARRLRDGAYANYADMYADADGAAAALSVYAPPAPRERLTVDGLKAKAAALRDFASPRAAAALAAAVLLAATAAAVALFYVTVASPAPVDNNIRAIGSVVVGDAP